MSSITNYGEIPDRNRLIPIVQWLRRLFVVVRIDSLDHVGRDIVAIQADKDVLVVTFGGSVEWVRVYFIWLGT